jgi:hypothetical protein
LLAPAYPAYLVHASTDMHRPLALEMGAHDGVLPFAVTLDLVEVGEHLIRRSIDLNAVSDHRPSFV